MKLKIFILSSLIIGFMSCKDNNQSQAGAVDIETVHEHDSEEAHNHDEHGVETATELALNNGQKWKSDEPTQMHAQKLVEMAEAFKTGSANANLESYRNYSEMVQNELNGMIKDCKMQGIDHDALHLWLEPVLNGVKELKDAKNTEDAKEIETHLTENIIKYNQFFN